MLMKNNRHQQLLSLLKQDSYTTSEQMAQSLNVSSRTIRNDLSSMRNQIEKFGAKIEMKKHYGYRIKIIDMSLFSTYLNDFNPKKAPTDINNRFLYILDLLLYTDEAIKIESIAEILYVSPSTLRNDLKKIRRYLKLYDMDLIQTPYKGIQIKGEEKKIRASIIASYQVRLESDVFNIPIDSNHYTELKETCFSILMKHEYHCSPIAFDDLVLTLIICKQRINTNHPILEIHYTPRQNILNLSRDLYKQMKINASQHEITYLAMILESRESLSENEISKEKYEDTKLEIDSLLKILYEYYYLNFFEGHDYDDSLIKALILHYIPLSIRLENNISLFNPSAKLIKQNYPLSYHIANIIGSHIKNAQQINESEISNLVPYFELALKARINDSNKKSVLLITDDGAGFESLIKFQFKQTFTQHIKKIDVSNSYEITHSNLDEYDNIFTTIPLPETLHSNITHIPSILNQVYRVEINSLLRKTRKKFRTPYPNEQRFFTHINCKTKEEVLNFLSQQVSEPLLDDLLKREEIVDSYFANGSALVSPLKTDTSETIITIVILNKSIKWGNHKVRLICMVNNENTFNRNLMRFYEIISIVLNNAQYVNQIIKDKSFETFMRIFKMVENDLLTN